MDLELGFLVLGNLAGVVDGGLLSDETFDGVIGAAAFDVPAAGRIWNDVMSLESFGRHIYPFLNTNMYPHYSGNFKYQKSLKLNFKASTFKAGKAPRGTAGFCSPGSRRCLSRRFCCPYRLRAGAGEKRRGS